MSYIIRPMEVKDIPQVVAIDRECFPGQPNMPNYESDLRYNEMAHYLVVCEQAPKGCASIIGVIGFWLMVGEAHIITICVRNSHRRQGIGELLLGAAVDLARSRKAFEVTLEVRATNEAARAMYKKHGFTKRGSRKRYYDDTGEDAVIMTKDFAGT